MILSSFLTGVAFFCVGPSELGDFPNSLVLMGIGLAFVGLFSAGLLIPGLPEMVEAMKPKFPKSQEREVNDYSSGIFGSILGLGQVLAPMYGSTMTTAVGFRMTSDIVAIICIVFALIYFFCGDGVEAFKTTCRNIKSQGQISETDVEVSEVSSSKFTRSSKYTRLSDTSIMVPRLPSIPLIKMRIK